MSEPHCAGCGLPVAGCNTAGACTGPFEPPRHCTTCGKRLRVVIIPTGWTATCREHGDAGGPV
ncbi:MAG: biotin synthase auxiliary protein BsaP [Acidimicrobiales bacterium]